MKDRYTFDEWPVEWIAVTLSDFPSMRRETRLWLAKVMKLMSWGIDYLKAEKNGKTDI